MNELVWENYADNEEVLDYMENHNDIEDEIGGEKITLEQAQEMINNDYSYWDNRWEFFKEELTEMLGGRVYWRDDASRMGWRNLSGFKIFEAKTAEQFIDAITPNTDDFSLRIKPYYKGFKIRISHHDSPTGEYHIVKPLTAEQYEKENEY